MVNVFLIESATVFAVSVAAEATVEPAPAIAAPAPATNSLTEVLNSDSSSSSLPKLSPSCPDLMLLDFFSREAM